MLQKRQSGKKTVAKIGATSKKAATKATVKKAAVKPASKKVTATRFGGKAEPGFKPSKGGILVPEGNNSPSYVTTGKLQAGIESAKDQIKGTLQNIASVFTQDFEVSEIELSVTFTADGKFLGFGTGGAMSVKVKIHPSKESDT